MQSKLPSVYAEYIFSGKRAVLAVLLWLDADKTNMKSKENVYNQKERHWIIPEFLDLLKV